MKSKKNGTRKTKIYRDMVISFEARLQDLRNQMTRTSFELDKLVGENLSLKDEKRIINQMLEGYNQELSKLRTELGSAKADLASSLKNTNAWETVAIEYAQENARLIQQIRLR